MNPLLTSFDTAPFSTIKNEHFKPAFLKAMENARLEIKAITDETETPTFKNTIEALEFSGHQLDRISSVFFNLNSAETNEEIQQIAQEISPLLSEFSNDITLNENLFKRVRAVFEKKETLNLTAEQSTLLQKNTRVLAEMGPTSQMIRKSNCEKLIVNCLNLN